MQTDQGWSRKCAILAKSPWDTLEKAHTYIYFITLYYEKLNSIAVLTVLKSPPLSPQTVLTTKAPIKDVEINIVKGEGGKVCIVKRMCDLHVLLPKYRKTFGHNNIVGFTTI